MLHCNALQCAYTKKNKYFFGYFDENMQKDKNIFCIKKTQSTQLVNWYTTLSISSYFLIYAYTEGKHNKK